MMVNSIPLEKVNKNHTLIVNGIGAKVKEKRIKELFQYKKESLDKMYGLIDYSKELGLSREYVKSYWNTYHCLNEVIITGNKLYGHYCKNRFCEVCKRIQQGQNVNKYIDEVLTWKNVCLVTLTVPSCSENQLIDSREKINTRIKSILRSLEYEKAKDGQNKTKIIRVIECGYNENTNKYNPHLHLVVEGAENAKFIVNKWIKKWKESTRKKQLIQPVNNSETDLKNVLKYIFKGLTKATAPNALHNILTAFKGKHRIIRTGFKLNNTTKKHETFSMHQKKFQFNNSNGWIDEKTGEVLTSF